MNTSKTKEEEQNFRIDKYRSIDSELYAVNKNTEIKSQTASVNEQEISASNEILNTFLLYFRDRVKLTIVDKDGYRYFDNSIAKVKDESIIIQNPFLTYANKKFPDTVKGVYENEGIEYSFELKKIKDLNNHIECVMPTTIKVLSRRGSSRVSPNKNNKISVGLFLEDKQLELIGSMSDISKIGVGLSFEESMLDSEILSFLTEAQEKPLPLIIDNNGEYFSILINVKHTFHNRKNNKVNIGAEFLFLDSDENNLEELERFFSLIEKEYLQDQKINKTKQLILSSKMGISF